MNLLIWSLTAYAITTIIIDGKIFKFFRDFLQKKSTFLHNLFTCPMCLSFWVGVFLYFLIGYNPISMISTTWYDFFLSGCYSSGSTILLYSLREKLYPDW